MKIIGQLKAILGLDKSKFDKGLKGAEKSSNKFMSAIKKIGGMLAAAFAVRKIVQWGKALLGLTDIQAKSEKSLLVALKGRRDIQQSLIKQAQELQKKTLFGDETTIEGAARLAQLLGQDEEAISRLLPLVQDLATAKFGGNLVTAADMVAKSVGSSTNALSRYGITIEGAVGSSERLESAIAAMNQQVGGQAEAAAQVGTGALTQLKNMWGDYKEYLGSKLLPVMNKVAEWGKNFIEKLAPKQSAVLRKEQIEINSLVGAITNENTSREVRKSLIEELQRKYPDFLGNLNAEKVTNDELLTKLKNVNKEYENKIKLAVKEELVYRQRKKYADSLEREWKAIMKLEKTQNLLVATQEDINKETDPDILTALIDKQNIYEGTVDRLTKKIAKEQQFREELNKEIEEQIVLLGDLKKKAGIEEGGIPSGGKTFIKPLKGITPEIISKYPKIFNEENIKTLQQAEAEIDAMISKITELAFAGEELGNTMQYVFGGFAEVIGSSLMSTEDILADFGRFFADFVKQMIVKLIAATIAAAALAVVLTAITGGGVSVGGIFKGMSKFKDFFKAGFGQFSGFGAANGLVVPSGFPNDTYPAMLTSKERVLTPAQNRAYESGMAGGIKLSGEFRIKGTDLVLLYDETKSRTGRTT